MAWLPAGCRYLVIGDPVEHSRSPEMQNAGLRALHWPAVYGKLAVSVAELPEFVAFAREKLDGFNITVPHKEHIIPFLDEVDPAAGLAGSVNTVRVAAGRLSGCSTDGYGIETAIRTAFGFDFAGRQLLMIGAGGAARAIAFHLASLGIGRLDLVNRTPEKAERLLRRVRSAFPELAGEAGEPGDRVFLLERLAAADLIIQAGSLGLKPEDPPPFDLTLLAAGKEGLCCFDTIYGRTPFLAAAGSHDLKSADGRGMLLYQGVKSLEIWTGKKAPVEIMRRALEKSLSC